MATHDSVHFLFANISIEKTIYCHVPGVDVKKGSVLVR